MRKFGLPDWKIERMFEEENRLAEDKANKAQMAIAMLQTMMK
jgi:hypothetical protein